MPKKNIHTILRFVGVVIMLLAFVILPDSQPWYSEVLLFDVGLILTSIPKLPKLRKRFSKNNI